MPVSNGVVHLTSKQTVTAVLERLLELLNAKAITVFIVVDHSGEAAKAGLTMPDTKLVLFGNPKAGTPIMVAAADAALDLPLKILIAETPDGSTRISYSSPQYLQARHGFPLELTANIAAIEQIAKALIEEGN